MKKRLMTGGTLAAALIGATVAIAAVAQTAAHDFTGAYEGETGSVAITRTGPGQYKLAFSMMYQELGGGFATGDWERTGTAKGNVLSLDNDGTHKLCRLTYALVAKRPTYRMTGCGSDMDGAYRRKTR